MKLRIEFKLQGCARHDDASGVYHSWCPALDLHSQGETIEEAKLAINSAVRLYVVHCYEKGTLESVLNARGFQAVSRSSIGDGDDGESDDAEFIGVHPETDEQFDLDVPLELIAMAHSQARGAQACPS